MIINDTLNQSEVAADAAGYHLMLLSCLSLIGQSWEAISLA